MLCHDTDDKVRATVSELSALSTPQSLGEVKVKLPDILMRITLSPGDSNAHSQTLSAASDRLTKLCGTQGEGL